MLTLLSEQNDKRITQKRKRRTRITMGLANKLAAPQIKKLVAYQSARRIGGIGNNYLNANESPYPAYQMPIQESWQRYPDFLPGDLTAKYGLYSGTPSDCVLTTRGADEGIDLLIRAFCEPNKDSIVINTPTYSMYDFIAEAHQVSIAKIALTPGDFKLDVPAYGALTAQPKIILLCHPNNPTGSIVSKNNMKNIIEIASKNNCWLLSDEVYRGAELNGVESPSFYGTYDKTIVNAGLSKAYRLPGLRIGWTVGPEDYIKKAWAFHDYTSISIAYHSDWVASKVLDTKRRNKILDGTKSHLNQNMNTLLDWVNTCDGKLSLSPPQAGAIAFSRINIDIESQDLTYHIRDNFSVLLTAGKWFGLEGFLRFGYGPPNDYLLKALERIGHSLDAI